MSSGTWAGIAAGFVGLVFIVASITKLSKPGLWRAQSTDLGVPWPVAAVVPYMEAVVGAALVSQWQRPVFAWAAAAVLVAFTTLLVAKLAQGERPPCACFGSFTAAPIGPSNVVRNLVLIALAVTAALLS
jgi:uncharacterized membrane protein YphA (DoxX/SURF4 family)